MSSKKLEQSVGRTGSCEHRNSAPMPSETMCPVPTGLHFETGWCLQQLVGVSVPCVSRVTAPSCCGHRTVPIHCRQASLKQLSATLGHRDCGVAGVLLGLAAPTRGKLAIPRQLLNILALGGRSLGQVFGLLVRTSALLLSWCRGGSATDSTAVFSALLCLPILHTKKAVHVPVFLAPSAISSLPLWVFHTASKNNGRHTLVFSGRTPHSLR
jgi:hypothetical protein